MAISRPTFDLHGFADAKPSEAIQAHELPGLAVAVVFPRKPGADLLEIPARQYKDYPAGGKWRAARRLTAWLKQEAADGLQLTGFVQVAEQLEAAACGLSLIEELPETRVQRHFNSYRLYFGQHHIDFAQAVALEYYDFTINLGALRAGLRLPGDRRNLFVALDRFPGRSPEVVAPGSVIEPTPGSRFLAFARNRSSTGQEIRRENESLNLTVALGVINWWRPRGSPQWLAGKCHPHFVLPDWLAAAALAESYPDQFARSFRGRVIGDTAVDSLRELYAAFKTFDVWSMIDCAGHVKGSKQLWAVPDDARRFIVGRVDRDNARA